MLQLEEVKRKKIHTMKISFCYYFIIYFSNWLTLIVSFCLKFFIFFFLTYYVLCYIILLIFCLIKLFFVVVLFIYKLHKQILFVFKIRQSHVLLHAIILILINLLKMNEWMDKQIEHNISTTYTLLCSFFCVCVYFLNHLFFTNIKWKIYRNQSKFHFTFIFILITIQIKLTFIRFLSLYKNRRKVTNFNFLNSVD